MARRKQRKKRDRRPKPATDPAVPAAEKAAPARSARSERSEGPPPPIWGDFPLSQLVVLGGLILLAVGVFTSNPTRVLIGLGLGSLGGLELAVREHFSGYRSHTTLLAGIGFAITIGVTGYWFRWVVWLCLLAAVAVFAIAAWLCRRQFIKASGGHAYKLR